MGGTEVYVALLGVFVTMVGWGVAYLQTVWAAQAAQKSAARLAFTNRQLERLYGPLAFQLVEGQQEFEDLLDSLGRRYVFLADEALPEAELKTWLFWVEHAFLPRNSEIRDLIANNADLIEGEELPGSFVEFLKHNSSWIIRHRRWQVEGTDYGWHSGTAHPKGLVDDVLRTFRSLRRRQNELMGK